MRRPAPTRQRPIRVVYVINSLGLGGAERVLYDLVTRLDAERFRPEVISLYYSGRFRELLESSAIPVHVLGLNARFRPRNWVETWLALRHTRVDVVHTHMPESAWYGLPAAYCCRVPVRISHLHSVYLQWSAKAKALDRAVRASASLSVACSDAVRDAAQVIGYANRKLRVIPNGIDVDRFTDAPSRGAARGSLALPQDALVLISVGSLYEHKGHAYLLEAMVSIRREFPQARLLLVGDKHRVRRATLEEMVDRLGLRDVVRFLGQREDVPMLLAASDVFVLPSLREGFGIALLEAGAAGLPAVASAVGGIPEIVEDGVTGLLVPPREPSRLADALLALLREPSRRQAMGYAARRRVNSRFTLRQTVRRTEDLYLELLERSSR